MRTYNIHDAKTQLSKLIDQAANGESVVIAKAGTPVARLVPIDAPAPAQQRRVGFLAGEISVPDDFNAFGQAEIAAMFDGRA